MFDKTPIQPAVPRSGDTKRMGAEESMQHAMRVVAAIVKTGGDRPSLVSRIAIEIGAEIVEGEHAPGADLNSVELSKRYSTSRTPVREALLMLEKEGLVTIQPRRRPRVMRYAAKDVREIYRTRCALLEFIAADVARHATDEDINVLSGIGEEMRRTCENEDVNGYVWANVRFHDLNTNMSRNRTVKRIIDSLLLRTLPLRRLSLSRAPWMAQSLEDHLHLIRAYRNRDPNLAAALLRSNHMKALSRLESQIGDADPEAEYLQETFSNTMSIVRRPRRDEVVAAADGAQRQNSNASDRASG